MPHLRTVPYGGAFFYFCMHPSNASFPEINTDRLLLRPLQQSDAAAIWDMHRDADTMRWYGSNPVNSLAGAKHLVSNYRALHSGRGGWCKAVQRLVTGQSAPTCGGSGLRWALQRRRDGLYLGSCGFLNYSPIWHRCSLGYELTRHVWGQGYMQEALEGILHWGFRQQAPLNRVEALIHQDNALSIRLAGKLGFNREGRMRSVAFWGNKYHDMDMYTLFKKDFQNR